MFSCLQCYLITAENKINNKTNVVHKTLRFVLWWLCIHNLIHIFYSSSLHHWYEIHIHWLPTNVHLKGRIFVSLILQDSCSDQELLCSSEVSPWRCPQLLSLHHYYLVAVRLSNFSAFCLFLCIYISGWWKYAFQFSLETPLYPPPERGVCN